MKRINKMILNVSLGLALFSTIGLTSVNAQNNDQGDNVRTQTSQDQPNRTNNNQNNQNQNDKNQNDKNQTIAYTSQITNMYTQNGKERVAHLGQNSRVVILDDKTNPNLVKVRYGNHDGYIYTDKLSTMSQNEIPMYVANKTNLYAKPDQNSKKLKDLKKFSTVQFQGKKDGWWIVKVDKTSGYVPENDLGQMLR